MVRYKTNSLAFRRLLNRKLIWPQRKVNRMIRKYDEHLRKIVYGKIQTQ
jgi:hypothetical protein